MNKLITVFLSFIMLLTPTLVFAQEGDLKSKADALADLLLTYGNSSVQYAMLDNGEITMSGGADAYLISNGNPVYNPLIYGIGSVSKMYAATAVMILADDGKIDIDTPITNYMPDFVMKDARYVYITPRTLLNYSSGLYGSTLNNAFLFDDNDTYVRDNFLANLAEQSLKANPGEFSVYGNDNFTLLEILVERVSGMSYTEFIHMYITEPLGLQSTKTPLDDFDRNNIAYIYKNGFELPVETVNIIGAGGIYSTAEELAVFSDVLMGNREDILSKEAAYAMMNEEFRNGYWVSETQNVFAYGLGWDSVKLTPFYDYGVTALVKNGDTMFYHSSLIVLPEYDMAAAVVSSGGSSTFNQLMATNILLDALLEKGIITETAAPKAPVPPVAEDMPDEMKNYAGLYAALTGLSYIFIDDGEMIILSYLNGTEIANTYYYVGGGAFKNDSGTIILSFDEHNGAAYLKANIILNIPGLGQIDYAIYDSQKLELNPIEDDVIEIWEERRDKIYFVVNEKATSQLYAISNLFVSIKTDLDNGYAFGGVRIIDADNAVNALRIPINAGRDVTDLQFYTENGVEYLKMRGYLLIDEDAVTDIFAFGDSICTISPNGYARWYRAGDSAEKNITVDMPEGAAFAVYDENYVCVHSSIIGDGISANIPNNGFIVFAGNPGEAFKISIR